MGAVTSLPSVQSSVEMFDPAVNQWFQLPDMLVNMP
jgi:hypothetical protein